MLPRIKQIVSVQPYKVTYLWNTGEVREVDLQPYITASKSNGPIARLADEHLFEQVKTDGRTLYWDNLLTVIDYDGSQKSAPLDFDPDVMYSMSRIVSG
ncbi:MAG: DUF2442 domain-containing protein [Cytophagaceae bacterium]|nr:DUF2442 domain-containing protein [Cytophagaceae bacterium]